MNKIIPVLLLVIFPFLLKAQRHLLVNGEEKTENCSETLLTTDPDSLKTSRFNFKNVTLENECLTFYVNFGCGHGTTDFRLFHYELNREIHFFLSAQSNDIGRALCHEQLSFKVDDLIDKLKGEEDNFFVDGYGKVSVSRSR